MPIVGERVDRCHVSILPSRRTASRPRTTSNGCRVSGPPARPSSQLVRHLRVRGRSSSGEKENIMALNTSLIAIIARRHPQIWEIVGGGPAGPGGFRSRLDAVALNPQPLPPAFRYGAAVGRQVVQTAVTAHLLKIAFEPGDDICPPPRHLPPIPFPWPPEPAVPVAHRRRGVRHRLRARTRRHPGGVGECVEPTGRRGCTRAPARRRSEDRRRVGPRLISRRTDASTRPPGRGIRPRICTTVSVGHVTGPHARRAPTTPA